jgi:hypothetical protein
MNSRLHRKDVRLRIEPLLRERFPLVQPMDAEIQRREDPHTCERQRHC